MDQHVTKFRVNERKSYSERMSETRAELRRLIQESLRAITGDDIAVMRWPTYLRDVVQRYNVIIEGWPENIPFRNLSDLSNVQILETLLRGWQTGTIRFRRITSEELGALLSQRSAGTEGGGADE
ncbi:hypothetical protein B0H21DRAFT_353263 [Amylocystis lapponica]|nr:hypothetical protein B0H21DRAFT_353263 [Amylocystis lapponica]